MVSGLSTFPLLLLLPFLLSVGFESMRDLFGLRINVRLVCPKVTHVHEVLHITITCCLLQKFVVEHILGLEFFYLGFGHVSWG